LTQRDSLPAGRDPDYQAFIDEQRKARRLLARMELNEDVAHEWEQFAQIYTHLTGSELEHGRQQFANTYRRIVGVLPDQRESLQRGLDIIMRSGNGTVDAAIIAARKNTARVVDEKKLEEPFA
jgi:hypothetical protein